MKVVLFAETGLARDHLARTAEWFARCPGPVTVEVVKAAVELERGADGIVLWETLFAALRDFRGRQHLAEDTMVMLLTKSRNEFNWYAAQDENCMRNAFGHVADFSWATAAPPDVISTHYILKSIYNALLTEAGIDWKEIWHIEPRGCFFDFCAVKSEINFKLRTADICGDCMEVFRQIGIPDSLLRQTVAIMEACRPLALNTRQYRETDDLFARWPFPVAVTRHKVVQATNPLLRFLLLLDHFDSLIRYFYLARSVFAGTTPEIQDRPALGWWVDQLAQSLRGADNFREVIRIAQTERVVQLRNERRGHGYMACDPGMYEHEADRLEEIIGRIETEMEPFFSAHRLVIFRGLKLENAVYGAEFEELQGSHLLHRRRRIPLQVEPREAGLTEEGNVYVTDPGLERFYCISPFIRSTVCPSCHHPRVLVTDGGNCYIDVFMGHRVNL